MTRETRLNLIFLAIILAILTPGGLILFRKKLQPTLKPMAMPHAVQREHAYLSPLETPPGKKRVEPPHTAKWVESLVRERIGDHLSVVRPQAPDGLPLLSDKKTFQVVATAAKSGLRRVWIVDWDAKDESGGSWIIESPCGREPPVRVVRAERVPVPPFVREELGEMGVLRPPHAIVWHDLEVTDWPVDQAGRLIRAWPRSQDFVNFVPSFTNSGATRH